VLALWLGKENTIRWWLPPSPGHGESYESVFAHGLSMHQKCSNYALTNLLFGLCRSMRIIDLLVTLPSPHPEALTCPSTPKMLGTKKRTPTPHPSIVFTLDSHLNLSRSLGVHHIWCMHIYVFENQSRSIVPFSWKSLNWSIKPM
jgi:hypothetical protein